MELIEHQKQVLSELVQAANDMAAASSVFGSHGPQGFEAFVEAREHFCSLVGTLKSDIEAVDQLEHFRTETCSGCYKRATLVLV